MGLFRNESEDLSVRPVARKSDGASKDSGQLTYTLRLMQLHGEKDPLPRENLLSIFGAFDDDQSGGLDRDECVRMVRELYSAAVARARSQGAPRLYIARAGEVLETERGRAALQRAADELLALQDLDGNKSVSGEEFCALLDEELQHKVNQGTYWRMAPICDVKLVLDDFVDDRRAPKLFAAGAFAGACARTAGAPLSRITILQQTALSGSAYSGSLLQIARTMVQKEGIRGIFRGNGPDVARAAPQQGISFLVYEKMKRAIRGILKPDPSSVWGNIACSTLAGGSSGVVGVMCTYPLDLVRTRLAANGGKCKGVLYEMGMVLRTCGPSGLYRGAGVAAAEKFPNLAINFALYDLAKNASLTIFPVAPFSASPLTNDMGTGTKSDISDLSRDATARKRRGLFRSLGCGIFAGAVSNAVTFPIDVVMKNLQLDGSGGERKYTGAVDCFQKLVRRGGVGALYNGLGAQLCKAVPVAATSFAVYDAMKETLGCTVTDTHD
jgi:Ca2+-binding EF-hand superfamily protein